MSPQLLCSLPYPFGSTWLKSHNNLRSTGSLWLFSVWVVVSTLLPQEWKVVLFTGCATVLLMLLASFAKTNRWRKVAASLLGQCRALILGLMAWKGLI